MARGNGKLTTINQKLTVFVGGSIALALLVLGVVAVGFTSGMAREKVNTEAENLLGSKAQDIRKFFGERANIVRTLLADPRLVDYFTEYDTFRAPVLRDRDYNAVIDYFDAVATINDDVKAVFFADNDTSEYFSNRIPEIPFGRVEEEGYLVRNRPWWQEAVAEDRLYLASPTMDLVTEEVAVVIQTTVYLEDGRLLGVGGADVSIASVGELVGKIKLDGQGDAFLIDDKGEVIYFTGADVDLETQLADLDTAAGNRGFAELSRQLLAGDHQQAEVEFKGEDRLVISVPVTSDVPYFNWTLGIVIPSDLISAPVRTSILVTIVAILFAILFIGGVTLVVSRWVVTNPISRLLERFRSVAGGEADLTRRVEVTPTTRSASSVRRSTPSSTTFRATSKPSAPGRTPSRTRRRRCEVWRSRSPPPMTRARPRPGWSRRRRSR